jgi:DNA-binding protein WhiA
LVARRAFALAKALDLAPELASDAARRSFTVRVPVPRRRAPVSREPAAFLRGAVLARGYVAAPGRPYHLEIVAPAPDWAGRLTAAMADLQVVGQTATRRRRPVVYVKDKEQVAALLAHLGAHRARLTLESESVLRSMKGDVNRRVNGEAANLRRAVESGVAQELGLQRMMAGPGWPAWPESFRRLAELRLDHPDWTLYELGRAMRPPLTKSGVAYRLRRMLASLPPEEPGR